MPTPPESPPGGWGPPPLPPPPPRLSLPSRLMARLEVWLIRRYMNRPNRISRRDDRKPPRL